MSTQDDMAVLCRSVVKIYQSTTGRVQAVRGVDLEIEQGTTTAVIGPSGSGKSSLLRIIAALDEPTVGSVEIAGVDLFALGHRARARERGRLITHVYQRPSDNLLAHLSAEQILRRQRRGDDCPTPGEALQQLGLAHRRNQLPTTMSGGEQQRLALARAVVAGHALVIADEPTAQLDPAGAESVLDAITELAARGTTVIVATHDDRVLPRLDQVVTLRQGSIASLTQAGTELAVIDRSGRLQLPPEVQVAFAERRAQLSWDDGQHVLEIRTP